MALLTVLALAGCAMLTGVDDVEITASSPYALDGCVRHDDGKLFTLPNPDGAPPTDGVLLGEARRTVVFAPSRDGNVCQWLSYGQALAQRGFGVALYDRNGRTPAAEQLAAVVAETRARGARSIMLVGAGDAACTSLIGASRIQPEVDGVVALSPPRRLAGQQPIETHVRKLRMPLLFASSTNDSGDSTAAVRAYEEAAPAVDKQVVTVDGTSHGIELLSSAEGEMVATAIETFLDAHSHQST